MQSRPKMRRLNRETMSELYPFTFTPHFKERVWGGRNIEAALYGKALPPGQVIGESWEITDRPEGVERHRQRPAGREGQCAG